MRNRGVRIGIVAGVLVLGAGVVAAGPVQAAAQPCRSRPAGLPQLAVSSWLTGVSVLSVCDAWAVGGYSDRQGQGGLIEHWNGSSWTARLLPGVDGLGGLSAVTALSRSDAWAVGSYYLPGDIISQSLALHWNGRVWRQVPVPGTGPRTSSGLAGVSAVSPRDIWAVGAYQAGAEGYWDLIEHWNGRAWHRVRGPRRSVAFYGLVGVTAIARNRVWGVGAGQDFGTGAALIRWDGRHWRKVRLPRPAHAVGLDFGQVAASSSRNAWAVGGYSILHNENPEPLAMHWNGKSWTQTPLPGLNNAYLTGVAIASPTSVWAVGTRNYIQGPHFYTGYVVEHWNGRSWKVVRSPNPSPAGKDRELNFMAGTSGSDMWAVGQDGHEATHALALHCCQWRTLPRPSQN
jgi:regulation of enolase protein 1 (concanavalin A-like superfamily)